MMPQSSGTYGRPLGLQTSGCHLGAGVGILCRKSTRAGIYIYIHIYIEAGPEPGTGGGSQSHFRHQSATAQMVEHLPTKQ